VPLDEIAKVLYIPLEQEIGITYIRKRGIEISYNEVTQQTAKDGIEITWSPIVNVDGKLFISVKYIARETGFKTEYIQKLQTLRVPYGSKPHVKPAMQQQLNKHDYKMWDWDVDSNDWM